MLSLTKHNEKKQKRIDELRETQHLANVLCPECLIDDKEVELHKKGYNSGIPPQVNVWCSECNFEGRKIV